MSPPLVWEAMRYSLFAGGKRLRPLLALAAAEAVAERDGHDVDAARDAGDAGRLRAGADPHLFAGPRRSAGDGRRRAAARPADRARRVRRGAGDSRRRCAAHGSVRPARARAGRWPIHAVARTESRSHRDRRATPPGASGMVGGQAIDLAAAGRRRGTLDADGAARHARPQDRRADPRVGAGRRRRWRARRRTRCGRSARYGAQLGLAFQIVDDILDVEGASADLGKTAGKDAAAGKPTYPALYGLEASRRPWRQECVGRALGRPARRRDRRAAAGARAVGHRPTGIEENEARRRCSSSAVSPRRASGPAR